MRSYEFRLADANVGYTYLVDEDSSGISIATDSAAIPTYHLEDILRSLNLAGPYAREQGSSSASQQQAQDARTRDYLAFPMEASQASSSQGAGAVRVRVQISAAINQRLGGNTQPARGSRRPSRRSANPSSSQGRDARQRRPPSSSQPRPAASSSSNVPSPGTTRRRSSGSAARVAPSSSQQRPAPAVDYGPTTYSVSSVNGLAYQDNTAQPGDENRIVVWEDAEEEGEDDIIEVIVER